MPTAPTVTAVLTCHDRRDTTLSCLDALAAQQGHGARIRTVLVDDGSTDGTAEAVAAAHPEVEIVTGTGELWWNGGMHLAIATALRDGIPDHLLWLNDDTTLDPDALATLLRTAAEARAAGRQGPLVAGNTRDPDDGHHTYGGVIRPNTRRPMSFELVAPTDRWQDVDTINGNVVLVPRAVTAVIGNLDPVFEHAMGDYDYGLRARRAGFDVVVTPGTIGTCARNPDPWSTGDVSTTWRRLLDNRGLPPRSWRAFTQRWGGAAWPVYFVSPYLRRLARAVRRGGA